MTDPTIITAIEHPELFRRWFRDPVTWATWFAFLRSVFGLPMSESELQVLRACTGLADPPEGGVQEAWLICGRRSGKSIVLALIAVFLATFRDWRPYLAPGERGTVMVVATDRRQARVIYRYAHALLSQVPALAAMIERETMRIDCLHCIRFGLFVAPRLSAMARPPSNANHGCAEVYRDSAGLASAAG